MISNVLFWHVCFWLLCWHRFGTKSLELVCSLYCYIKLVAICRKRKNCRLWRLPAKDIVYDIFSFPNHPHHLHEASWIDCSEHEAVRHAPRSFGSLTFRRWLPSVYQSLPLGLPGPTNHIFILTYCSIAWNGRAGSSRKSLDWCKVKMPLPHKLWALDFRRSHNLAHSLRKPSILFESHFGGRMSGKHDEAQQSFYPGSLTKLNEEMGDDLDQWMQPDMFWHPQIC